MRERVRGKVWLVGAGPGDVELLTVKAARVIAAADVIAYDELVSAEVLALGRPDAERVAVGRRAAGCRHHEARIHPAVILAALAGKTVVRLKGGDPFIFGRGGEEAEELAAAHVPFEVVPGISAALGAAAQLHIPLTHRECSASVTFATAHAREGEERPLAAVVPPDGTLVLYMGLRRLATICEELIALGRGADTPACVVSNATRANARAVFATLGTLAVAAEASQVEAPALVMVGDAVARRVESPVAKPWQVLDEPRALAG
jgi:uroporphyrin-III C-methyltransferase/precorrin-2 dehydrogenase/sirohydrochlorin ferrochelatase